MGVPYIKIGDFNKLQSTVKSIIYENSITNIWVMQIEDDVIKPNFDQKKQMRTYQKLRIHINEYNNL